MTRLRTYRIAYGFFKNGRPIIHTFDVYLNILMICLFNLHIPYSSLVSVPVDVFILPTKSSLGRSIATGYVKFVFVRLM
jgi:hypothetical protein